MKSLVSLAKPLILALTAVLAPVKGAAFTALALCLLDLFTGLLAAYRQKEPLTSNGFGKTIVKILVYEAAILLTFLVDTYLAGFFPLSNVVSGWIGLTELKSILENLNILAGGNLLKSIIQGIQSQSSNNTPPPSEPPTSDVTE